MHPLRSKWEQNANDTRLHSNKFIVMKKKNIDLGLLILRITFAVLTLMHGWFHLTTGVEAVRGMLASMGLPEVLAYGVLIGELVAPLLILVGYYTRWASAVAVINFITTIAIAHTAEIFKLTPYGGSAIELNLLYMVIPLALIFTGAGKYAINKQ